MRERIRSAVTTGKSVASVARETELTFVAASIAYYAFVSLIPLLVVALVAAALVGGDAFAAEVGALADQYLLPSGRELVLAALGNTAGSGGVTVVGLVLAFWGSLKLFRGLDTAFSRVYGTEPGGLIEQVTDAAVALVGLGVGVLAVTIGGGAIAVLGGGIGWLLGPVLLVATLVAAFLPLYYRFPDANVTLREVLPGTVTAAVGWDVLGVAFGAYAAYMTTQGSLALYGILGGILLLLTWFYLAGLVVLLGAVVNAVVAGRVSDRQLQQEPARRVDTTDMSADENDRSAETEPRGAPDIAELEDKIEELQADLAAFESDVSERTVEKGELETELKQYVRGRLRRGHARGWGPYLVLLYGTVLTLGSFYFLSGGWAILAMLVVGLSTLGLYVVFLVVGLGLNLLDVPGKAIDAVRKRRG